MKQRRIIFFIIISLGQFIIAPSMLAAPVLQTGGIYIEIESYGRAWYIWPRDKTRYYLRANDEALATVADLALGINNADLAKISQAGERVRSTVLARRLAGYFLLAVEDHGRLWYVDPATLRRRVINNAGDVLALLRQVGRPIKDKELAQTAINQKQIMFDPTYKQPTYAKLLDGQVAAESGGELIRPLASLTKLLTALVLLDQNIDWQKNVTVTAEQISYPASMVGDDLTSEVELLAGDQIMVSDLWISMLVASSNQAAVALADSTGMSRTEFVERMNLKARDLGLARTKFYDIAGLDSHNVGSARDMAKLAAAAFQQEKITNATQQLAHSFQVAAKDGSFRTVTVRDRNFSLRAFGPDAVKTGYLVEAQRNSAILKGSYIIVILNAQSMRQRNDIIRKLWQTENITN